MPFLYKYGNLIINLNNIDYLEIHNQSVSFRFNDNNIVIDFKKEVKLQKFLKDIGYN